MATHGRKLARKLSRGPGWPLHRPAGASPVTRQQARETAEVAVIGAGPAGLAAALALAAHGLEVALVAPAYDPARAEADRRTTALLPTSLELLKNLDVWKRCAEHGAALEGVRIVDDRGGLLRAPEVLFKAQELGLSSFGANIANSALNAALHAASLAFRLTWIATSAVVEVTSARDGVRIALAEGGGLRARLAVAADGRGSITRAAAGISTRTWAYDQTAIATTFAHDRPHGGTTTELHRRAGPLTTVPLPGNSSSLVWVERPEEARRLMGLDETAFLLELEGKLQGLLGPLHGLAHSRRLSACRADRRAHGGEPSGSRRGVGARHSPHRRPGPQPRSARCGSPCRACRRGTGPRAGYRRRAKRLRPTMPPAPETCSPAPSRSIFSTARCSLTSSPSRPCAD